MIEILRYLDWMMHLSEDLERRLREEIREIKSEKFPEMTEYVTSWERFAKSEGKEEKLIEMVERLLEKRCGGKLTKTQRTKITKLSIEQLDALFDAGMEFTSKPELNQWLKEHC